MKSTVRAALAECLDALRDAGHPVPVDVEIALDRPKRPEHGDLASGVALALARATGAKPRELADRIAQELRARAADESFPVASVEVAGPGFLNLRVRDRCLHDVMGRVLDEGPRYGHGAPRGDGRALVEFVSANPTGPLHLGHGRGAVVGDVLVRVMRAAGWDVATEYYVNDAGAQVRKLAASVRAARDGAAPPEGGYGGAYVRALAEELQASDPGAFDDDARLAERCVARMMEAVRATLARLDVRFDAWSSERALVEGGAVQACLDELARGGHLASRDGALFFEARAGGEDDKDRVVRKANGELTYFATDLAYHRDKLRRGYARLVDVWGADHHGYVARVRAGLEALGLPKERFEALLLQLVKLVRVGADGARTEVKFSKRAGTFVTADDVLDEIDAAAGYEGAGRDALRFLFLLRSHDTALELDLDVATRQSVENPVFYAQMTHARMCSILERAATSEAMAPARDAGLLSTPRRYTYIVAKKLTLPEERDILAVCDTFPELVQEAAATRSPHRVAFFVTELAQKFASYFTRMQKVYDEPILPQRSFRERHDDWVARWDWEKTRARLLWVTAVRQVYANALALLGVAAPTRMSRHAAEGSDDAGA